jgi:hypothetical protein
MQENDKEKIARHKDCYCWKTRALRDPAEKSSKLRPNATKRRAQWNLTSSFIPRNLRANFSIELE